jgi:hypothetical protein
VKAENGDKLIEIEIRQVFDMIERIRNDMDKFDDVQSQGMSDAVPTIEMQKGEIVASHERSQSRFDEGQQTCLQQQDMCNAEE